MNSTRIISFTLCLGLACLLMMGNALAGTTEATEVKYAREVGGAGTQYVIPTGNSIVRTLSILPSASFFVKVSLDGNAEFDSEGGGGLPEDGDLMADGGVASGESAQTSLLKDPEAGDTSVEYLVRVDGDTFDGLPVFSFNTEGWVIKDPDDVLGGGGVINVTVTTRAANTGSMIDAGNNDSASWLRGVAAVKGTLKSTTATIDVATARTMFLAGTDASPAGADTATRDEGATLGFMTAVALNADGSGPYALDMDDAIELVVTGDLTGITEIVWNEDAGGEVSLTQRDKDFDLANGVATLKLAGNNAGIATEPGTITIIVDGSTLNSRTLNLAVNLDVMGDDTDDRELVSRSLTVWELNGTVFLANFVNGNNDVFHSRVYLFNHGQVPGDITVRAFTLPVSGESTPMGTVELAGRLMPWSGRNIRVAEDVLMPILGETELPYTTDGGNLVLEITIDANNIAGTAQVIVRDPLSSFGIYQLKSIN